MKKVDEIERGVRGYFRLALARKTKRVLGIARYQLVSIFSSGKLGEAARRRPLSKVAAADTLRIEGEFLQKSRVMHRHFQNEPLRGGLVCQS